MSNVFLSRNFFHCDAKLFAREQNNSARPLAVSDAQSRFTVSLYLAAVGRTSKYSLKYVDAKEHLRFSRRYHEFERLPSESKKILLDFPGRRDKTARAEIAIDAIS